MQFDEIAICKYRLALSVIPARQKAAAQLETSPDLRTVESASSKRARFRRQGLPEWTDLDVDNLDRVWHFERHAPCVSLAPGGAHAAASRSERYSFVQCSPVLQVCRHTGVCRLGSECPSHSAPSADIEKMCAHIITRNLQVRLQRFTKVGNVAPKCPSIGKV